MLRLCKKQKPKGIPGKRRRSPFLWHFLCVLVLVLALSLFLSLLLIPEREGKGVIVGLCCTMYSALPLALVMYACQTVCILSEDRLYFFKAAVEKFKTDNGKKRARRYVHTNGHLPYADIQELTYAPARLTLSFGGFQLEAPTVILHGEGFTVTLKGNRALLRTLQRLRDCAVPTSEPEAEPAEDLPAGVWGELLAAFHAGRLEEGWPAGVTVEDCSWSMDNESIDLFLVKQDARLSFNINCESLLWLHAPSDEESEAPLLQFANGEALLDFLRRQADLLL